LIKKNDLRKALNDIHDVVFINNINKSIKMNLLGSITLDNLCSKIGQISYTKIIKEKSKLLKHKNVNLYIATRLEKFGGHSRLLKDFIDVFPEKNHVILITDKIPKKDYEFFNKFLLHKKNVSVQLSLDASRENKLIWLQKKIIQVSPENIFLFNGHPHSLQYGSPVTGLFSLNSSHCKQTFHLASARVFCSVLGFLAITHASKIPTILVGSFTSPLIIFFNPPSIKYNFLKYN